MKIFGTKKKLALKYDPHHKIFKIRYKKVVGGGLDMTEKTTRIFSSDFKAAFEAAVELFGPYSLIGITEVGPVAWVSEVPADPLDSNDE